MSERNTKCKYIFIILFSVFVLFGTLIPRDNHSSVITYATHNKTASSLPLVNIQNESVNMVHEIIIPLRTTTIMSLFEKKENSLLYSIGYLFLFLILYNICPGKIHFYIVGIDIYLLHYIETIKYIHKKDGKKQVMHIMSLRK